MKIRAGVVAWCLLTGVAAAQPCFGILETSALMGADAPANAMLTWDPDGAGPEVERLVATGNFSAAGTAFAHGVVTFDGSNWIGMGQGAAEQNNYNVAAAGLYNGDLVVCQRVFANSTVRSVMKWNRAAQQWQPLGTGFTGGNNFPNLLIQRGSDLILAGDFDGGVDGVPDTGRLAAWNGSAWRSIGAPSGSISGGVVFNGNLVVCGTFTMPGVPGATNVASWDGAAWSALGSGLSGSVRGLAVHNGELCAIGTFTGGPTYAARFDGSAWQQLGTLPSAPTTLCVYNGELHCVTSSGITATLRRFDGTAWVAAAQIQETPGSAAVFQGKLYFGGRLFKTVPQNTRLRHMAVWDGTSFGPVGTGTNAAVNAFFTHNGVVYAGGDFTLFNGQAAGGVVYRTPGGWQPLGAGVNGSVNALTVHAGQVVAAGTFTTAGGSPASNIARWNGAGWQPLGSGVNGTVNALCVAPDGTLIVGGAFTTAGGSPALRIARWDGSTWTALGGGMDGTVRDVAVYHGQIVATGDFAIAQPQWVKGIAVFNGGAWEKLGPEAQGDAGLQLEGNLAGRGNKLTVDGDDLWVAGRFDRVGFTESPQVAIYRNGAWVAAGKSGDEVDSVTLDPTGRVVMAQGFYVYQREGGAWNSVVGPVYSYGTPEMAVRTMRSIDGALYIGGVMDALAGRPAAGWAAVSFGAPVVVAASAPAVVPVGSAMTLTVTATGAPVLSYQWSRNQTPIVDGGRFSGATTAQLVIDPAETADGGTYTVTITSGCGASVAQSVTVHGSCAADMGTQGGAAGQDGELDNNDFIVFIDHFFNHDPTADVGSQGGAAPGDGAFDNNDFVVFIDLFFAGCP